MNQVGLIATPGLIDLTKLVDKMKDSQNMALLLGEVIKSTSRLELLHEVQTNIIRMDISGLRLNAEQFMTEAHKFSILVESKVYYVIRLVTYRDTGRA